MKNTIKIKSSEAMIDLGKKIGGILKANDIITLAGDLGAGKTTLTKGIALGLDINTIVNSPTFTIMKTYDGRLKLFHLDVYRIENLEDDFELEEYFEEGGVCVIEWADNIAKILPSEILKIEIKDLGNNEREVKFTDPSNTYARIIDEVLE